MNAQQLLADMATFARLHVSSGDIDPAYPVLKHRLFSPLAASPEPLWHLLIYAAYYNLASAEIVVAHHPQPEPICGPCAQLPTGVERRNLRGGKVRDHVKSLLDLARSHGGTLDAWLQTGSGDCDPFARWQIVRQMAGMAWGNGRWATYKLAELCSEVLDWNMSAPDMGLDGASGPLSGLLLVGGRLWDDPEAQGRDLQQRLSTTHYLSLPLQQIETVLCDFHTMAVGRYYVGADIDTQQQQILGAQAKRDREFAELWAARSASFDGTYRGEVMGWTGFDHARAKVYMHTGLVLDRLATVPA